MAGERGEISLTGRQTELVEIAKLNASRGLPDIVGFCAQMGDFPPQITDELMISALEKANKGSEMVIRGTRQQGFLDYPEDRMRNVFRDIAENGFKKSLLRDVIETMTSIATLWHHQRTAEVYRMHAYSRISACLKSHPLDN